MKSTIFILGLIFYSTALFFIEQFWLLGTLLILNLIVLACVQQHSWRSLVTFLAKNCGFVLFVVLCNLWFAGIYLALLVGARLGLAILATYTVTKQLSTQQLTQGTVNLLTPLKWLKIDTEKLALSIAVALTFIPLLMHEAHSIQNNLKLKGFRFSFYTMWRYPRVYIVGIMEQLFNYIENVEKALRLKGYD